MLNILRKITPRAVKRFYHYFLAIFANFYYGSPSDKLIVIGVTGTSGKSTVVYLITKILEQAGFKVGAVSTIIFKVDKKEKLNDKKMTMIGRFALQKMIKKMVKANCQYAIIETTSEGIEQYRHLGINYDVLVFTNLYPEHIEAHGSFANYKKAKLKLFAKLKTDRPKLITGNKIKKTIIVNLDDEHGKDFLAHQAEEKLGFSLLGRTLGAENSIVAENSSSGSAGGKFTINKQEFNLKLLGQHNIYNALAAVAVCKSQQLSLSSIAKGLAMVESVPGRLEFIDQGQLFKVIVDYAFEPKATQALYDIVKLISHKKIIHVLGAAGGGRDKSRRLILGQFAGANADIVIVTNEDPYDEDPGEIINTVWLGAKKAGKKNNKDLFKVADRGEAISQAINLAKPHDVVLITGKGSEQAIVTKGGKIIPWDDRQFAKSEIDKTL
ncbi:MAG: hypothetical protein CMI53_01930 [Parcubacteria group bacterium]|nr:hypothetical protein [Parcubacteria group bacterium]|tara:strand:+ start:926 stop:2242 length:1317 start_codon:yes stop_codon:yes gene_type:complete